VSSPFGVCPACGYCFDQQTNVSRPSHLIPRPGDVGICAGCGELHIFKAAAGLRLPNASELRAALASPTVRHVQAAVRRAAKEGGDPRRVPGA
jgi:hypothetical protein